MNFNYKLDCGCHGKREEGMCAMEWVAFLAGEEHSDAPSCVAADLQSLFITMNDMLEDAERQELRKYLTRTIGTVEDNKEAYRLEVYLEILALLNTREFDVVMNQSLEVDLTDNVEYAAGRAAEAMVFNYSVYRDEFRMFMDKILPLVHVDIDSLTAEARPIILAA